MLFLLQQNPLVVDVIKQPEAAPDISVQVVLGMFMMAGVALAVAAVGGLLVGGTILIYRRDRDAAATTTTETGHTRLRI